MSKRQTPVAAIRARCLNCQGGRPSLVRKCEDADCPLHPFRLGTNPRRKGIGGRKRAPVAKESQKQGLQDGNSNSTSVIQNDKPSVGAKALTAQPVTPGPACGTYRDLIVKFRKVPGA